MVGVTDARIRRWTQAAVVANLTVQIVIVVTGGAVRLTGSGLGCSTWPQCEPGQFVPVFHEATPLHTYIEYGNRMIGVLLGFIGIALAVLATLAVRRLGRSRALRALAYTVCGGIILQGLIGGLSVRMSLNPAVVGSHFLISAALLVISTLLAIRWFAPDGAGRWLGSLMLRRVSLAVAVLGALVVALGVVVTGAGPHSGDETVGYRFAVDPYLIARLHAMAVWGFVAAVGALIVLARREHPPVPDLRRWSVILLIVTLAQGAIGYVQFFTGLPELLVGTHLAGAAVLIVVATRTLMSQRTWDPHAVAGHDVVAPAATGQGVVGPAAAAQG